MTTGVTRGPQANWLPDGKRLHLHHGPIDLIVEAFGAPAELQQAYRQAVERFQTILAELVEELGDLRGASSASTPRKFAGSTARRMEAAVVPLAEKFITPLAAVAGSVADEMMAAMTAGRTLDRAYVNNGGDIALHLSPGQAMSVAIAGTGNGFADRIVIRAEDAVRGVATSGWRGRSFSLGIADAVTVLARSAAQADAAATIIANAVDLPGHAGITRVPARELSPDSDLGARSVTQGVGDLTAAEAGTALDTGLAVASTLRSRGLIDAAVLFLAGNVSTVGDTGLWRLNSVPDLALLRAPLCPAGHLPHMGGNQADPPPHRYDAGGNQGRSSAWMISPRVGEMSGRTEGGNVERNSANTQKLLREVEMALP